MRGTLETESLVAADWEEAGRGSHHCLLQRVGRVENLYDDRRK